MSRITKKIAEDIAAKVVNEKHLKKQQDLKEKLSKIIVEEHDKFYSNDLIKLLRSNYDKSFFNCKSSLYFSRSLAVDRWITAKDVIFNSFSEIHLSEKAVEEITKINHALIDIDKEKESLKKDIYFGLINCKTYKNVSQNLPKLVKYLPKIEKTEVQINFKYINDKL